MRSCSFSKKAIVLLSGGLDSATTLYIARARGFEVTCLVFDYGQRHSREVAGAEKIAQRAGCACHRVKISLPWKGSSLLDRAMSVPRATVAAIPSTYVPARNIIFLSFALSCAEALGARHIFIGANAVDYSGYPDCRPDFYRAFRRAASRGTKCGVSGRGIRIETPLIRLTKSQIIKKGLRLGVPYELTWSCYRGEGRACGRCDSCRWRAKGFKEAGLKDPALS